MMGERVVLYTKEDCELCDEARAILDAIGEPYALRHDPAFALRVPVIEVDGLIVTEGRVSERAIRRALAGQGA